MRTPVYGYPKYKIVLGGILLAIVAVELLSRQEPSRQPAPMTPSNSVGIVSEIPVSSPVNPRSLPAGFTPLGDALVFGKSSLTIENGTKLDALVKVMLLVDGKPSMVRNFYVPAQMNWTEQKMPKGTFILRVAQGLDFDVGANRFTYDRRFTESIPFDLSERVRTEQGDGGLHRKSTFSRTRITLHKVVTGNFLTSPIDEGRFAQ